MEVTALARAAGCEPAVLEWTEAIGEIVPGLPDLGSPDMGRQRAAARVLSDTLATRFTAPAPQGCTVTELRVPTRAGSVAVLHHRPAGGTGPRAAHVTFHGGGFVHGSVHEVINDRLLRHRAVVGGVDVFDVDYRLAPEHPFPAALEDCLDALTWIGAEAGRLGIDPGRIGVGGASAGGNLAALVALAARACGPRLDHVVLEVPLASMHVEDDASFREYGALEAFTDLELLRRTYLGPSPDPGAIVAPADVDDLAGLPPTLVVTAECDPLRDCGQAYAARLAEAGVPVEAWCAPRQMHGSSALTGTSSTAREWQDRICTFLRARTV
jgi:acetyl esterase